MQLFTIACKSALATPWKTCLPFILTVTGFLRFTSCSLRYTLSLQSLEKAHENERQAMERYNEGEISIVEVIEAQTYRQNAEINHVQAKASAQGQYSALIKALNQYK
jgi:outer membrane protein TolC